VKTIDLTLTISSNLPSFPGSPQPQLIPWSKIKDDKYNLEMLFLSSHTGTHIDTPYHFVENGDKIHEIPLKRLVCNVTLIKLKKKSNEPIKKTDIIKFEKKHEKIKNGSTVIFYTGWQKNLQKASYFKHNPGLAISAAKYLVLKHLNMVGIDAPSIDLGINTKFSVHHILLKNNVLIVENLCNLEKISKHHFNLVVLPIKLKDASGSPVRAIAIQNTN